MTDEPQPLRLHRATDEALSPDDYDADDLAAARREGLEQVQEGIWAKNVPPRFTQARVDMFPANIASLLTDWGRNPRRRNLVLLGPTGTGKTTAAVAAARIAFVAGLEVRFFPVVELFDLLRPGGPEGALYDLADVDILVLDDLAAEKASDWTAERLYALVNRRWLETSATITTSNLEPDQLEAALGERTFSRLVGNDAVVIRLVGQDRRRAKP